MIRTKIVALLTAILAVFGMKWPSRPALTYGAGVYTNLCGSGVAANVHRCSGECDPVNGECEATSFFVAKWVCDGKLTECGDNETWASSQSLAGIPCGKTVSLNVFDKNCRVGWWTCNEANLKDYMVWYSGECTGGEIQTAVPTLTQVPTVSPTARQTIPTLVPSIRPTVTTPTPTLRPTVVPTLTVRPTVTIRSTGVASPSATLSPVAQKTPKTGGGGWLVAEAVGVVVFGLWFQKLARRVWK